MNYRTSITTSNSKATQSEYDEFADNMYYDIVRPCFRLLVHYDLELHSFPGNESGETDCGRLGEPPAGTLPCTKIDQVDT